MTVDPLRPNPTIIAAVKQEITVLDADVRSLPQALLDELLVAVEDTTDLIEEADAPSTVRAHKGDWTHFTDWCERYGLCPLPAAPETVALYIGAHSRRHKPATIKRRLSTISVKHKEAEMDPPVQHEGVRRAWRGLLRKYGAATTRKQAARTDDLRRMVESLNFNTLTGLRDRAILVVGFACAFRRSEVVGFDIHHVEERPDGLAIRLPWSKTNSQGDLEEVGTPWGEDRLTCPVRAWRDWIAASGLDEGPPFRPVTKHGTLRSSRLSGRAVAEIVKRTAKAAGYDPALFAGHSLRAGLITSAAEADVPERDIMRQSRHKSVPVMRQYIRSAHLFKNNAAARVGL